MNKFYITTTLPYVNDKPHIGFALEIIQADVIARFQRILGKEVFFNTGTDEHGLKIYRKALEEKKDPQKYVDENATQFAKLKKALNLSYTHFIRTTNPDHVKAAQEFWQRCEKKGDIYKAKYKIKYCVGCELEKSESELESGKCPIHPNSEIEEIKEENYFFRFSKYQKPLLEFYDKHPDFVVPDFRFNEIKQFVKSGLNDFSISRLKEKMPWGVPVPNDPEQIMYVWFDALINYISTLGWPKDEKKFTEFWGTKDCLNAIQTAGKDNLRQQSAMWQAMLISTGLPNSKQILIHGFITSNGQKMSKSLGNVVDPFEIIKKCGVDALRYWLLSQFNPFEDIDFTWEKFNKVYNADLANGLGNLAARVAKLCEKNDLVVKKSPVKLDQEINKLLQNYKFNEALAKIWLLISDIDKAINEKKPWELKENEVKKVLEPIVVEIQNIASHLKPFLPETAEKIEKQFKGPKIISQKPLFPRIQ